MFNLYFIESYAITDGKVGRNALNLRNGEYDFVLFDKYAKSVPVAAHFELGVKIEASNADVIRIDGEDYLVCPHFKHVTGEPTVLKQKRLGNYAVTVYDNGEKNLIIETDTEFFNTYIKDDNLKYGILDLNGIVCVRGEKILILLNKNLDLIHMTQNADYRLTDDGFETVTQSSGVVNRTITEFYGYNGELKNRRVDYGETAAYPEELTACAFIEAILCGDYAFAREMLDEELRDNIEDIALFIGGAIEIVVDGALPFYADKVLLRYVDGYKLYKIDIGNGLISNIMEI